MLESFTDRARKIMALANQEAMRLKGEYISSEHILLGVIKEGTGVGGHILKSLGVTLQVAREEVEKIVGSGPDMVTMGKLPQSPSGRKTIEDAILAARDRNENFVGTEHLLLGLLASNQDNVAHRVLTSLGVTLAIVRAKMIPLIGIKKEDIGPDITAENIRPLLVELHKYLTDSVAPQSLGAGITHKKLLDGLTKALGK